MLTRSLARLFVVFLLATALAAPALGMTAQATPVADPVNPFADLGLPQIDITVTDTAFEGIPGELEAGRYVVALTNALSTEEPGGGAFMQLPEGMAFEDFAAFVGPAPASADGEMAPEGSPVADMGPEGSPAAEDGGGGDAPPDWYYEVAMAGGPYAGPNSTVFAVVELTAGDWVFWAEYPGAPQGPVSMTVSGELPADAAVPTADVRIEMSDFEFALDGPVNAGLNVIELPNVGEQPHFILVAQAPDGTTEEDVLGMIEREFMAFESGTPAATPEGGLSFEDVVDVFSTGDQSAGTTAWYAADLQPGTHVAICFVTDPETGMPHVMLGMIEVFEVE